MGLRPCDGLPPAGAHRGRQVSPDHVGWCKASAWALGEVLAGLPRPMSRAAMVLDLDFMVDRRKMTGEPVPGVRLLSRRWGVGVKAARLAVEAWRRDSLVGRAEVEGHGEGHGEGHAQGHGEGHALSATMPMDSASLAQEGHAQGHGEGHGEGHAQGTPLVQEVLFSGIVEAPQTTDIQTSEKPKKQRAKVKPAGLTPEELAAIVADMHAIIAPHYPKARPPSPSAHRKEIEFALRCLAGLSEDTNRPPRDLLLMGWRYMVEGTRYWRERLALASEFYSIACTEDKCVKNARAALEREAVAAPAADSPSAPKPKTPGEVAWDRWMQGLDVARAWYSAHKGTREGDAFHAAMEAACKPNPIAELFGGYMDNPKEKRLVREVFIAEYERRTTPLRLVAR